MAITYNGTKIDKIKFNGTEIFGTSELTLAKHEVRNNVNNFEYNATQPIDGYLIISNARQGTDSMWAVAKAISGVEKFELITQDKANYSTAKQGQSIYRLKCNTGGKVKIWSTNEGAGVDNPNQDGCVIMNVLTGGGN